MSSTNIRRPGIYRYASARSRLLTATVCCLFVSFNAQAGKPGGTGGSGGSTASNPDIVYLSASSQSVNTVEVRGVTLSFQSGGAVTATDSSMLSNATGRSVSNIAWSPDGKRFAWIENGAILTAVPGGRPAVLYPTKTGDPKPLDSSDTLAWGPDCCGGGDSVLAFLSELPSFAVQALTIKGSVVDHRAVLFPLKTHCDSPNVCTMSTGSAFAFSPKGQLLAFFGLSDDLLPGVWAIPMGVTPHTPSPVLFASDIGGTDRINSVMSMDWSPSGARLALSVITGTDPNYPWRDLKIVDLTYGYDGVAETVSSGAVRPNTNPGSSFGAASSEHSPQWDPKPGDACQRLAFSQSSDSGRKLYLVDLVDGNGCNTALRPMSAKNPRALDWRVK